MGFHGTEVIAIQAFEKSGATPIGAADFRTTSTGLALNTDVALNTQAYSFGDTSCFSIGGSGQIVINTAGWYQIAGYSGFQGYGSGDVLGVLLFILTPVLNIRASAYLPAFTPVVSFPPHPMVYVATPPVFMDPADGDTITLAVQGTGSGTATGGTGIAGTGLYVVRTA